MPIRCDQRSTRPLGTTGVKSVAGENENVKGKRIVMHSRELEHGRQLLAGSSHYGFSNAKSLWTEPQAA